MWKDEDESDNSDGLSNKALENPINDEYDKDVSNSEITKDSTYEQRFINKDNNAASKRSILIETNQEKS